MDSPSDDRYFDKSFIERDYQDDSDSDDDLCYRLSIGDDPENFFSDDSWDSDGGSDERKRMLWSEPPEIAWRREAKAELVEIVRKNRLLQPLGDVMRQLPLYWQTLVGALLSGTIERQSGARLFKFEDLVFARDQVFQHRRHSWSGDFVPAGEHHLLMKMARLQARFEDVFTTLMSTGPRRRAYTHDGRQINGDYSLARSVAQWRAERAGK